MRLKFNEYHEKIHEVFDENKFMNFSKLCVDTAKRNVKGYSLEDANAVIRKTIIEMAGLPENPEERAIQKAFKKTAVREAVFEIIQETVEETLVTGWSSSPFFKRYVEIKNYQLGQKNEFYVKDKCYVTVAEIADGHHSLERQRLGKGRNFSVSVRSYGAKVYMEMSRFLQGVEDWSELIEAISTAFTEKINTLMHDAVMSAPDSLPSQDQFNIRGELNAANKDKFMKLIRDVSLASGSTVEICGTAVALAGLTDMFDVNWMPNSVKESIYATGNVGTMPGGYRLVEIPQAFERDNTGAYLEADDKLLILPTNLGPFVRFYYEGSDEIYEVTDPVDHNDQSRDYEFKSRFGVGAIINEVFGCWTIGD